MDNQIVTQFKTASGRDFPVHWDSEAQSQKAWGWNESHFPNVLVPVFAWIQSDLRSQEIPYEEAEVEPFFPMRGRLVANGFQYTCQAQLTPEENQSFVSKATALGAKHGGSNRVWDAFAQPKSEASVRQLREAPVGTPVAELSRIYHSAIHNTHIGGMVALGPVSGPLQAMLAPLLPMPEVQLLTMELGQGSDSATMESNRRIDQLAEAARAEPAIAQALASVTPATLGRLREEPSASAFLALVDAYLETYGGRAGGWDVTDLTLNEQPWVLLTLVQKAMSARKDGATERREVAGRRAAAVERVEGLIGGDPEKLALFQRLVPQLDNYIAIREGRALWQLMGSGALRTTLLRKGAAMAEAGVTAAAEDIFFLLPDEIDPFFQAGDRSDRRELATSRRAEWKGWLGEKPPALVSANPLPAPPPRPAEAGDVVRGLPGSRGLVTAKARVLLDFDQCEELGPGEVLVCVMTSPPWTPLFGVASAIVTDSGLALSHPAIAAREYGIPCVVGAAGATSRVKTGDTITVDGDAGTVTILQRA